MYEDMMYPFGMKLGWLLLLAIWVFIWKGWALWISARKHSKVWFVVLLILNTAGILPILYIFVFSKMGMQKRAVDIKPTVRRTTRKTRRTTTKKKSSKRRK